MANPKWDETEEISAQGPSWDDTEEIQTGDRHGAVETIWQKGMQGLSMGFGDELEGVENATIQSIAETFGLREDDKKSWGDKYIEERNKQRTKLGQMQEDSPVVSTVSELGGSLPTAFLPGMGMAKGATTLANMGKAAVQGGVAGLGHSDAEDLKGMATDTAFGAGLGAAFQGVGEKVLAPAARYIGQKSGETMSRVGNFVSDKFDDGLKKLGKVGANVPEDATEAYLKNPGRYQNAKSIEELKDSLDKVIQLRQQGADGLETVWQSLKSQYDDALDLKRLELDDAFNLARETADTARSSYSNATTDLVNDLKSVRPDSNTVDDIASAIESLGNQVSKGSSEAFDALDREGVTTSRSQVVNFLKNARKSLEVEGQAPLKISPARKHYDALASAMEDVAKLPEEISGSGIKRIIQDLDDSINYIETVGGRSGRANTATAGIRHGLDQSIKGKSEGYTRIMDEVARKTDLLSSMNKSFGTKEQILNRILELPNEHSVYKRDLLKKLSTETGINVDELITEYMQSQSILREPGKLAKVKEMLPEYSYMQKTQQALDDMPATATARRQAAQSAVDQSTGLPTKIADAETAFRKAKQELQDLGLSERRSEAVVKAFERGNPSIEDRRAVQALAPELIEELENTRVAGAFERSDTNGSRRTLMGAIAGKAVGGALGAGAGYALGDDVGAGAGALAGFGADRYAGKLFKGILNGKIAASKATPELISKLGRYGKTFADAASRGSSSLAATHFVLQQTQPEYRQITKELQEQEDDQ